MNSPALLLRTSLDQDADGTPESITSETYSADNKILQSVLDSNADGQADAVTSYTYNDSGDQTGLFFDNAADGSIDYSFTTDYTTDANGILTVKSISSDGGGPDEIYISKFDSVGNLIEEVAGTSDRGTEVTATYGYNDSGQLTTYESGGRRTEYAYDAAGRISGFRLFSGDSTTPASTTDYAYDEAGNVVRQELDSPAFGSSSVTTYTYDEQNRLVGSSSSGSFTSGPGGGFSAGSRYEYNAAGQITSYVVIQDVNGRGGRATYTYEYDDAGNLVREVLDGFTFGGLLDGITEYGYDAAGRITSLSVDADADGTFDSRTSYAYDDLLAGGVDQSEMAIAESSSAIESDAFADDSITQLSLGTNDIFSSSELISSDLLETSTLLEAETDTTSAASFLS